MTDFATYPDVGRRMADAWEPRVRVRPSLWAEQNVILDAQQSPRPGPFRNDYLPWISALHDLHYDHPEKIGAVAIKPSQIGFSRAIVNVLACLTDTEPGPALYLTSDAQKAKQYANSWFRPVVLSIDRLAEYMAASRAAGRRQLKDHFELPGGDIDFVGAGTESGVISVGRRWIMLDEFELSERNFPSGSGSLFEVALERAERWKDASFIWAFGHPRFWEEDLHRIFMDWSDQGRWVFDCPHCGSVVDPTDWEEVIDWGGSDSIDPDPSKAIMVCRSCAAEISDRDRSRAVWPDALGGSGRHWSPLSDEEAHEQPMVGLWITRICDPEITVEELADSYVRCQTAEAKQTWTNKRWGGPFRRSKTVVTAGDVRDRIQTQEKIRVPGGRTGVKYCTGGVDVQAPRELKTLYFAAVGYAPTGIAYVVDLKVFKGWAAYHEYRAGWNVERVEGSSTDRIGLRAIGLDCGWETRDVLDETRLKVHSSFGNSTVFQMGLMYNSKCDSDVPVREVPEDKCVDPTRPHLGPVPRRYLHRHTWVDRVLSRIQNETIVFLCQTPPELEAHLTSQVLSPLKKRHETEDQRFEWALAKGRRDDWLQAIVYAEAIAAIKLGLDRIHRQLHSTGGQSGGRRRVRVPEFTRRR